MIANWSEIKEKNPFFWLIFKAWLKSKGCTPEIIDEQEIIYNQYIIATYDNSELNHQVSDTMFFEMFDELDVRLCIDFDKESEGSLWNFKIFKKKGFTNIWYQDYCYDGVLPNRPCAILTGIRECIYLINSDLEKESKMINFQ